MQSMLWTAFVNYSRRFAWFQFESWKRRIFEKIVVTLFCRQIQLPGYRLPFPSWVTIFDLLFWKNNRFILILLFTKVYVNCVDKYNWSLSHYWYAVSTMNYDLHAHFSPVSTLRDMHLCSSELETRFFSVPDVKCFIYSITLEKLFFSRFRGHLWMIFTPCHYQKST